MQNNFILELLASLKKHASKQQIKADIKSLGDFFINLTGRLEMSKTKKTIQNQTKGQNINVNLNPTVNQKNVQNTTKQATNTAQKTANANKIKLDFNVDKSKLINEIKLLGKNNNKLFDNSDMTAKYNSLLTNANVAKSSAELKSLRKQLSAFKVELQATNNAGMNFGSRFKESLKRYASFFSGASVIYGIRNTLRSAATEAKGLDDRLVDLQKVSDEIENRDSLYKYFDRAMKKAKELNVKVDSLLYAITEYKKMGWSLSEAEIGAEWATKLENVGDVDIDTAIGSIKTAVASFEKIGGYGNDQMDKKIEAYVDLINEMSNKYSIDAEGLAEAIRLSGGTLTEAHMSIEQAASIYATANKRFGDPRYLANTMKIGSLRLRAASDTNAKAELEAMGEEIDNVAGSASKLREKLLSITGVDIMIDDNTFKSYYDQLYEISKVMDDLTDVDRANVLETLFGKNRSAAGASILASMKDSTEAYETAINSAGSATEEYQVWMESADAASQRFANSVTETYQSIINGNTIRDMANMGTEILDFANSWGIVEGSLRGVLVLGIGKFLTGTTMALITGTKQAERYGQALQLVNNLPVGNQTARRKVLEEIAQATSSLTGVQLKYVLSNKALTESDRLYILQKQGLKKAVAQQKLAEMGLIKTTNAQTKANVAATASTFSLKNAMIGLGASIKTAFMSNPIGLTLMAVSVGISAVTSAVSGHNQKLEEARNEAKQAADEANTLGDEVAELATKYLDLSEAVKTDAGAKEDLLTTQTELLKKLGLEGESVKSLTEQYGSLTEAIRQTSLEKLKESQLDLLAGVDVAKSDLLKSADDNFWGTKNIINANGSEELKAIRELQNAGIKGAWTTGIRGSLQLIDDGTVDSALKNYKILEEALTTLRDSEAFTAEELANNPMYQKLYGRYNELKTSVEGYNSAITNLNENLTQQTMLESLQGQALPQTEEAFNTFKQELIDSAVASNQFIGTQEQIAEAIDSYLSTVPEFEGFFSEPLENELNNVNNVLSTQSKTAEEITSAYDELNKQLDSIQSAYNAIVAAQNEYAEHGELSIDTLQGLLNLDSEYLACLVEENGQLMLNGTAYENLVASRLNDAKALIVEQAISELNALTTKTNEANTYDYVQANALLAESLASLTGNYEAVQNSAIAASKAEALAAAMSGARDRGASEADIENIISNMNARLKFADSTIKSATGSFEGLDHAVRGYGDSTKGAKSATDAFTDSLKKEKEALEAQKKHYEGLGSAVRWFYDQKIDGCNDAIDTIEKENDALNKQKDDYDDILVAIDRVYEREIEALEKEKDAIDDKISALQDANNEKEKELALEKAQFELEKARSQRSIRIYERGKGFVFRRDEQAVKDAQQKVEDAQTEIKIGELEKQKDVIDEVIENLEEYRKKWQEIPKTYEQAQQDMLAKLMLGENFEQMILQNRITDIENFKNNYTAIEAQINDNQALIDSINERIAQYETLKQNFEDLTNKYRDEEYRRLLIQEFGVDYESVLLDSKNQKWQEFSDEYFNVQQKITEITQKIEEAAKRAEDAANRIEKAYAKYLETGSKIPKEWTPDGQVTMGSVQDMFRPGGGMMPKYHDGIKNGEVRKLSPDEEFSFLQKAALKPNEVPTILQEGEAVLNESQISNVVGAIKQPKMIFTKEQAMLLAGQSPVLNESNKLSGLSKEQIDKFCEEVKAVGVWKISEMMGQKLKLVQNAESMRMQRTAQPIMNFNGDLSFPNIRNGNDAQKLINELKLLGTNALQDSNSRMLSFENGFK